MELNIGKTDATIRALLAIVFFAASLYFNAHAWISLTTALAALVLVATALTRKCPMYTVFRIHTNRTIRPSHRG